jgi:hypothetical protein
LLQDDFVIVLRKDHPAAGSRELSMGKFALLSHLAISSVQYATDFVYQALAKRKLKRRIQLRAPWLFIRGTFVAFVGFDQFALGCHLLSPAHLGGHPSGTSESADSTGR